MARISRRRAVAVAIGALTLTLLSGGLAAAAPSQPRPAAPVVARPDDNSGAQGQPPVSKAEADKARESLVPATGAGMPPTAQSFFAVVDANGTLARGFGATSATRLGVGIYQVVFSHDVRGSAYVGTLGLSVDFGISPSGEIAVVGRAGLPNGIFVQTFNSAGQSADRGFHLAVLS
jgi:hypothetical protein